MHEPKNSKNVSPATPKWCREVRFAVDDVHTSQVVALVDFGVEQALQVCHPAKINYSIILPAGIAAALLKELDSGKALATIKDRGQYTHAFIAQSGPENIAVEAGAGSFYLSARVALSKGKYSEGRVEIPERLFNSILTHSVGLRLSEESFAVVGPPALTMDVRVVKQERSPRIYDRTDFIK